tara:strand:+ start:594 stop:1517 length:924 start_codon:yes stop_codon:yes gene_type:complete
MKVAFMGNPEFALPSLKMILASNHELVAVISNAPKPMGRKRVLKHTAIGEFAISKGLNFIELNNFDNNCFEKLESLKVDIFIVVAFRILPEKFLSIPNICSINLHGSILPQYRGAAPIQWALMNGDKVTGVSVFKIEKRVDSGKIISQKQIVIEDSDNFYSLSEKLSNLGAEILIDVLNKFQENRIEYKEQDLSLITKAPKINKKMLQINWAWSAEKINNWVRGLAPMPGMVTIYNNRKLKLLKTAFENRSIDSIPGSIITASNVKLEVCTGKGILSILELQQEGKTVLSIENFLRGSNIKIGDVFH